MCGIRKLVDTYEMAMSATALKGTSRVFPPEVMAWSMIAVDEADVPRAHPKGRPDETVTALKRMKLPDMPTAVDVRLEPTLVILDLYLAQSKNKTLQYFCEDNGWAAIIVIDPYVRHGLHVPDDPIRSMINVIAHVQGQIDEAGKGGGQSGTSDDYANRRIHIFVSFEELKKARADKVVLELVQSIERLPKTSQCICSVHVNEEATSFDNVPVGAKLFTWISDTGVLTFRASGVTRAIKVLRGKKLAFEDSTVPKAYAVWDLWIIRASTTVALMLLDPSDIASVTDTFLTWARQAGDCAWDVELTTDRVVTLEEEVARAKSAMEGDSKVMIRKVLASSVPTATPLTQACWIAGDDASRRGILCAHCNSKRRALGIPAPGKEKCADSNSTPDLGYTKQSSTHCINCCALCQGLGYLGRAYNADNPDEKTIYEDLKMQQMELTGILLAVLDHGMFNSPVDGCVVSPDIDFVEWMIVVYSAVKGTKTEKDLANWGFIRCPPAVAVQKFLQQKGSSLSVLMGTNDNDMNFLVGNDLESGHSQFLLAVFPQLDRSACLLLLYYRPT